MQLLEVFPFFSFFFPLNIHTWIALRCSTIGMCMCAKSWEAIIVYNNIQLQYRYSVAFPSFRSLAKYLSLLLIWVKAILSLLLLPCGKNLTMSLSVYLTTLLITTSYPVFHIVSLHYFMFQSIFLQLMPFRHSPMKKLSICDDFYDGKTSNVVSSPRWLSSLFCVVEFRGLVDDKFMHLKLNWHITCPRIICSIPQKLIHYLNGTMKYT